MDSKIRRLQPEAAIQHGARPVAFRRHQKGTKEFAEELARDAMDAEDAEEAHAEEVDHEVDHAVSPPLEGEAGSRIDLLG